MHAPHKTLAAPSACPFLFMFSELLDSGINGSEPKLLSLHERMIALWSRIIASVARPELVRA
jgi:hypothetical protein